MSSLTNRIQDDLKAAMKARDSERLAVIRALKTAMTNAAIEKGGPQAEIDDATAMAIVRKQVKQRQDSASQFRDAGRTELADKEDVEIAILETYLPSPLSGDEITGLVESAIVESGASTKADMGKVMKLVQERAAGRADGRTLSQEVAKRLS
ncbi:GatB/YqeY domain-containing protein [Haloferula sp. A504]|uniref:GatB/YqeY domain-containing protein n=1 Tax=Haloferula sp. A504 TaxID=3373601 RepID=UPI0031BF17FB|nr:GatB/YqeY domain-containing protein [Verrucomicrobiaceae bacterium E54]